MKPLLVTAIAAALTLSMGVRAHGHGASITIDLVGNQIAVSNGLALTGGYAPIAFDKNGGDGEDGFSETMFSTAPGFEWSTFPTDAPLTFEVLGRPDHASAMRPTRWLWHWDTATRTVEAATANAQMEVGPLFGVETASFDQLATPAVWSVPLDAVTGQHHLMLYQLADSAPRAGVYGFFARLTSPGYLASQPFLMAFAYAVGLSDFAAGATSINAAAGLAGDFDVDGDVDGGDLLAWQRSLGTTSSAPLYHPADASLDGIVNAADLAAWRAQFGQNVVYPPASSGAASNVPEPSGGLLAIAAGVAAAASRRRGLRMGSRE